MRDSDIWSFDYGISESIEASDNPDDALEAKSPSTRQNHRHQASRGSNRVRNEYNSPPPDYRSSVRDSTKGNMPIGLVPSFYDVGGLYKEGNQATSNQQFSAQESTSANELVIENERPPLTRDVSVRAGPGFQRILKGWSDHQTSKRGLMSKFFRRRQSEQLKPDQATSIEPVEIGPSLGQSDVSELPTTLPEPTFVSKPAASKSLESKALPQSLLEKASIGDSAESSVRHSKDNQEQSKRPDPDLSLAILELQRKIDQRGSAPATNPHDRSPTSASTAQLNLSDSLRQRRPKLDDVPEHDSTHVPDMSRQASPPLPSVSSHSANYVRILASAFVTTLTSTLQELPSLLPHEIPIPPDHTRVRWDCSCGTSLHDDFIELVPGAAHRLEAYLNRQRPSTSSSPKSDRVMHSAARHRTHGSSSNSVGSTPSRADSMGASSIFSQTSTRSSATGTSTIGDSAPSRSDSNLKPTLSRSESHFVPLGSAAEPPWLLTCCAEAKLTPKVTHISMDPSSVRSDKDVALALRSHYNSLHSSLLGSIFRLRALKSIDFIKFELHRNRLADIRAKPHMPPYPHPSALPGYDPANPDATGGWEQATDYAFEPGHLVPPVGSNYLLHLFQHPHDYELETVTLNRVPKKMGGRLELGNGWGVELVEGFVPAKLWGWAFCVSVLGSAVFAIVWILMKKDMQGAFAVAAWVVGVGALGVGWLGAACE